MFGFQWKPRWRLKGAYNRFSCRMRMMIETQCYLGRELSDLGDIYDMILGSSRGKDLGEDKLETPS